MRVTVPRPARSITDLGGSLTFVPTSLQAGLSAQVSMVVAPVGLPDPSLTEALGVDIAAAAEQLELGSGPASTALIPLAGIRPGAPLLMLAGYGNGSAGQARNAGAAVGMRSRGREQVLVLGLGELDPSAVHAFLEGMMLGHWRPRRTGLKAEPVTSTTVLLADVRPDVPRTVRHANATLLARDLATVPANVKNPVWMADRVQELASQIPGLTVDVKDEHVLAAEGFGGMLAVGAGSATPPRLITVDHHPAGATRHVVLVGKGITFDTGGISIKPREAMVTMKTDMAGSAAVLAAVLGVAQARVPLRVTAVMAMAENHFGASSYRPGDVVTTWGGRTVEVANTDAEGRMVLADAMAWSAATLQPDVLVDVATLTGAATMGLGRGHAAVYGTDASLVAQLVGAGERSGERLWRMPLVEDYHDAVESDIADLRHVPETNPGAGSITAALFLQEFTGGLPWAHLDIAGPGRAEKTSFEIAKGPTGFGARLLLEWLGA